MSFFVSTGSEHCALTVGENVLGGRGEGALPLYALAIVPPGAVITVRPGAAPLVRRLSAAVVVKVDGEPLGATPRALRHGSRIDVGTCHLIFADASPGRGASPSRAAGEDESSQLTEVVAAVPAAPAARLVDARSGRTFDVPEAGLVVGRDRACDIAVSGRGVSRRHAVIAPSPQGYVLTDQSANGTYVNGVRVTGARALVPGDVLRIGADELRFETGASAAAPAADPQAATELIAAVPLGPGASQQERGRGGAAGAAAERAPAVPPLATLEVTGGPLAGSHFRVERPVCAIGRGEHNDVRLADASVSASHATLLLKGGAWFVVDLRSANGTYVDGYRVAGERALPPGGTIRVGSVTMRFRPLTRSSQTPHGTRRVVGFLKRLSRMF